MIWQMLHRLIKSRPEISDQMIYIYLLRTLIGKYWISSSITVSKENFSSKSLIYKLVCISLSYRNWQLKSSSDIKGGAMIPSSYKPNYSMYKLPLSNRLTNTLFSEKTYNGGCTWKIATSFKNSEHFVKPL